MENGDPTRLPEDRNTLGAKTFPAAAAFGAADKMTKLSSR
jgi:hypothetical protein